MELRHLEAFVALAEELHFGRAAERLQLSQPPFSQRIKQLERELGVQLFARTSRRVALTHAGRLLVGEARRTIKQADQVVDLALNARQGLVGALRVGYVGSALMGPLPAILRTFRKAAPSVGLRLTEGLTPQLTRDLAAGELDVVFNQPPVVDERVDATVIDQQSMMAVLPADHQLASTTTPLPLGKLAGESFVLFPRELGPGYMDVVLSACRDAGFTPNVVRDASAIYSMVGLVAAGQGVSIVPATVAGLQLPGVAYRLLAGRAVFQLAIVWQTAQANDPVLRQFVDHATSQTWTIQTNI